MKSIMKFFFLASFATLALTACDPWGIKGEGPLLQETRSLDDFDRVTISVPGDVTLIKDSIASIDFQIEETLLPYFETEVRNGRLDIYFSRSVRNVDDLRITIYSPDFNDIEINGSSDLISQDSLFGDQLRLDLSGSGSMTFRNINFETIRTTTSGSGNMRLEGVAEHFDASISGSGDIDALDCPVKTADFHISGSGTIEAYVMEHLEANISGSGSIWYMGDPTLDVDISGSGKVRKIQ